MKQPSTYPVPAAASRTGHCLSCGTGLPDRRRRYCSVACRQQLHYKLDVRTGLLRALNARYATFYFSSQMIVLDVMPYGVNEIYSFMSPRRPGRSPGQDFSQMADALGHFWWSVQQRSRKRYLATRQVLEMARRKAVASGGGVSPMEFMNPCINGKSLIHLRLSRQALHSARLVEHIKKAYRAQVKRHHPDMGGDSETFRKVHEAYLELIDWSENPRFFRRRGFPDKWFYDGGTNRWVQPTPAPK